jgi:hypothetical protein
MSPRLEAARAGQNKYIGKPCPKCGGTERYVINAGCVVCVKRTKAEAYSRLRQEMLAGKQSAA